MATGHPLVAAQAALALTFRPRKETREVILHDTKTVPGAVRLMPWLEVNGRRMGLLEVGYHFIIMQTGKLITCRPHHVVGAHMRFRNKYTIGVALEGGLEDEEVCTKTHDRCYEGTGCPYCEPGPVDNFNADQKETLRLLMVYLRSLYGPIPLRGHSEVNPRHTRRCPALNDMEAIRNGGA